MRNLIKLKVLILFFSTVFPLQSIADDRILPLPKPSVGIETKAKTTKKKEIYPQKKPTKKIVGTKITDKSNTKYCLFAAKEKSQFIFSGLFLAP